MSKNIMGYTVFDALQKFMEQMVFIVVEDYN